MQKQKQNKKSRERNRNCGQIFCLKSVQQMSVCVNQACTGPSALLHWCCLLLPLPVWRCLVVGNMSDVEKFCELRQKQAADPLTAQWRRISGKTGNVCWIQPVKISLKRLNVAYFLFLTLFPFQQVTSLFFLFLFMWRKVLFRLSPTPS